MSATSLPSILVTGATGSTGLEVVEALAKSGQFHVLAGVRDVAKARSIKALQLPGVSLVHLDSDAASAASAFRGVTGVYLLTAPRQPSFDVWFDAIQKGGVKHVVYHSAIGAAPSSPMSMGAEHGLHEEALKAQTQVGWTVFQPTFFHQNLDKFHAPLISQYSMYGGSADSGPILQRRSATPYPPSPCFPANPPLPAAALADFSLSPPLPPWSPLTLQTSAT